MNSAGVRGGLVGLIVFVARATFVGVDGIGRVTLRVIDAVVVEETVLPVMLGRAETIVVESEDVPVDVIGGEGVTILGSPPVHDSRCVRDGVITEAVDNDRVCVARNLRVMDAVDDIETVSVGDATVLDTGKEMEADRDHVGVEMALA